MNKKNPFFILMWIFIIFNFSTNDFKLKAKSLNGYQSRSQEQIEGKVQDSDGNGLPWIKVTLTSQNGVTLTTVTSETGHFRFIGLPPEVGTYNFEIEGFRILHKSIDGLYVESPKFLTVPEVGGVPKDAEKYVLIVEKKDKKPSPPPPSLPSLPTPTPTPPTVTVTGGVPTVPKIPKVAKKYIPTGEKKDLKPPAPPPELPRILKATISEDSGLNKVAKDIALGNKSALYSFYYSEGKILAKKGIARVGFIKKRLNKITRIPYRDEDYSQNGLKLEEKCVYSIRLGEKDEGKLIIRVLKKWIDKIEIEYYLVTKDE